jgi:rubrerythrin
MPSRTPAEILEIALRKEQASFAFYDRLMSDTRVNIVMELIEQLREEEAKHVRMIQKQMEGAKQAAGESTATDAMDSAATDNAAGSANSGMDLGAKK